MAVIDVAVPVVFGAVGLACLVVGLGVLRSAVRHFRTARRVSGDAADPVDAADVTPGMVAVSGTARPASEGPLQAPFTGGGALVAVGDVLKRRSSEAGSDLTTDERAVETVPFLVEDETGSVRVEPGEAGFHVERERFGPDEVDESALAAWSRRTGIDPDSPDAYGQRVVPPGVEVYVFGEAAAADGGDRGSLRIAGDGEGGDAVISTDGRERVGGNSVLGGVVLLFFGGLLVVFAVGALLTALVFGLSLLV